MAIDGVRLKEARMRAGLSQTALSAKVNVRPQTIQSIESGKNKRSRYLPEIASVLGVSAAWLSGEEDFVERRCSSRSVPLLEWIEIDNVELALEMRRADPGFGANEEAEYVAGELRNIGKSAFALRVRDESMAPTLRVGDRIIVDPDARVAPGCIVLVMVNRSHELRRLRVVECSCSGDPIVSEFIPDNALYPTTRLSAPFSGKLIGICVELRRHI